MQIILCDQDFMEGQGLYVGCRSQFKSTVKTFIATLDQVQVYLFISTLTLHPLSGVVSHRTSDIADTGCSGGYDTRGQHQVKPTRDTR